MARHFFIAVGVLVAIGCSNESSTKGDDPSASTAPTSLTDQPMRNEPPLGEPGTLASEETRTGSAVSPSTPRSPSAPQGARSPQRKRFTPSKFTKDDFEKHLVELKEKMPAGNFHIRVEQPFVIIGDEDPKVIEQRAARTVRWASTLLKNDFFRTDPREIIDIWLFKDEASYDKHAKQLTGRAPHTPFGFYSPRHKALIMNISTGGGTLVHEMVHPFVAADFPDCPSWLNEGLGSLFEQCSERDGKITGLTNWRLRGLQRAIREKTVPSFKTLCSTTTEEFYNADPGTNYSQARYLCYYLQQRGLLRKYYKQFRENYRQDPTGYQALKDVLAIEDMDAFKKSWEGYVQKLRFPGSM